MQTSQRGYHCTVPALRLAELAEGFPSGIDFVKIDVEGGEYGLIEQLAMLLTDVRVARLVIEYHRVRGRDVMDIVRGLAATPMAATRIDRSSTTGVGLVFFDGNYPR
jgi:hypothetical protein